MGCMELGSCYLRGWQIRYLEDEQDHDPGCGTAEKNHELSLGWERGKEVVGCRIGGSLMCPLAAARRGEVQDYLRLHQFLCAIVVVLVVAVSILIRFVVAIFALHMYAQQVFLVLSTGVLSTIACVCRRGMEVGNHDTM